MARLSVLVIGWVQEMVLHRTSFIPAAWHRAMSTGMRDVSKFSALVEVEEKQHVMRRVAERWRCTSMAMWFRGVVGLYQTAQAYEMID